VNNQATINARLQVNTSEFDEKTKRSLDVFKTRASQAGDEAAVSLSGGIDGFTTSFPSKLGKAEAGLAAFRGAAVAAGAGIGVVAGATYEFVRMAGQFADDLSTAAEQANINVERYQTLTEGLRKLEISGNQADQIFRRLTNTLGEVQGGTAAKGVEAALDKMGVKARILSGEIETTDQLFDAIAASAGRFGTEAEYTASVVDVVGRGVGVQLAAALRDGGDALREQEEAFRAAGAVIEEDYIRRLADANEKIDAFTSRLKGLAVQSAGFVLTVVEDTSDAISEMVRDALNALDRLAGVGPSVSAAATMKPNRDRELSAISALPAGSDARRQLEARYYQTFGESAPEGDIVVTGKRWTKDDARAEAEAKREAAKLAREQADAERKAAAAQREAASAAKALAGENDRLARTYGNITGPSAAYEKTLAEIATAEQRGLLTTREVIDARIAAWEKLEEAQRRVLDAELKAGGSTLSAANDNVLSWRTSSDDQGLEASVNRLLERAGFGVEKVADRFESEGIKAAQAIAQIFGGKVGGEVSKIAGVLRGLSTGDFTSVGGKIGGAATLIAQDKDTRKALKEAFAPVTEGLEKTFDNVLSELGLEGSSAGGLASAGLAGFGIGSALGGNLESGIGGAVGGMAGSAIGMAVGGPIGAAVGQALGSVIGSGIGGLFASAKKGSVTLGSSGGEVTVGAATGNSASRKANASELGGSVADTLNSIAKELGAGIGSFAVSVGQRDGVFSVDPTGRGMVSKKYGAVQFETAEEAARFAIQDAIKDGAFTGLTQTVVNALRNASTLEQGLDDAVLIQSVAKRLAQIDDPVGAAIEALNDEFEDLRDTLIANGATVAELADAERLYNEERSTLLKASIATLKEFQSSLNVGSGSPLSLTDQQAAAQKAFAAFESDILAGRDIDQAAYTKAAQDLLDVTRQIDGGTAGFFAQFDRVQSLTAKAISDLENVAAIREGPFAQKTAESTAATAQSTAALLNAQNTAIQQNAQIISLLQALGGGGSGYDAAALAGFVRAA
jgi:hypothetical protein